MNDQAHAKGPQTERSPALSEPISAVRPPSASRVKHPISDTERPERLSSLFPEDAHHAHDTIPSPPPDMSDE
ncbi:MAG: hypothetical protein SFV15_13815 [Polyangiaceae bacterium]|nr:hypothetical protein [Polyangiaceae bacterium]